MSQSTARGFPGAFAALLTPLTPKSGSVRFVGGVHAPRRSRFGAGTGAAAPQGVALNRANRARVTNAGSVGALTKETML